MKNLVAFVLVAVLSPSLTPGVARAEPAGYLTSAPPTPLRLKAERGERMKKHGQAASILGIMQLTAGMVAGIVSIIPCHSDVPDGCLGNLPAFASGATFTALGAISTSAGIPMWVYGAREERDAKIKLSASATGLRLTF